jgi:hypothetical protein
MIVRLRSGSVRAALPDPGQLPAPDDALMRRAMETWWIYLGEIAPSKLTECVIEPATDLKAASSGSDSTATFSAQSRKIT